MNKVNNITSTTKMTICIFFSFISSDKDNTGPKSYSISADRPISSCTLLLFSLHFAKLLIIFHIWKKMPTQFYQKGLFVHEPMLINLCLWTFTCRKLDEIDIPSLPIAASSFAPLLYSLSPRRHIPLSAIGIIKI